MKYRKKPVIIEAVRWNGDQVSEVTAWMTAAIHKDPSEPGFAMRYGNSVHINTLEGMMICSPGDYIIRGVAGEIYPCKPDIFKKTYEPIS